MVWKFERPTPLPRSLLALVMLAAVAAVGGCAGEDGGAGGDPGIVGAPTDEADQLREEENRQEDVGEAVEERDGDGGGGRRR